MLLRFIVVRLFLYCLRTNLELASYVHLVELGLRRNIVRYFNFKVVNNTFRLSCNTERGQSQKVLHGEEDYVGKFSHEDVWVKC